MNDTQRLEAIYGAAGRELRRILSLEPGIARVRAREIVKVLNMAVDKWASDAIPRAYEKGARRTRTSLEILGKKPRRKMFVDRARILRDNLMVVLMRANNSIPGIIDKYLAAVAMAEQTTSSAQVREFSFSQAESDIKKMSADAVRAEISHKELANKVRDYLYDLINNDEFIEIACADGVIRTYQMRKYAELVGRTELADAATAATLDLCREYDNDLVQWTDHGSVCEECIPHQGQVYSISGTSPDYPPLEEEPPLHPNCECGLLPTSVEAISAREEPQ